jgi:muramidase (phage lysozyme)
MALPNPLKAFTWGAGGAQLTPEDLARMRQMESERAAKGVDFSPVGHWTQGLARVADALAGSVRRGQLDDAATENAGTDSRIAQALLGGGASGFPAAPGSGQFPAAPTANPGGSGGMTSPNYKGDELAWADAQPYQKALLNTIAGPESGGRYNVIYGGGKFDDFSKHPGQAVRIQTGPNAGRTSSAAGKYQFLGPTWDDQAGKLGLTDFSPANQDRAAWNLAAETYKAKTGQDLDAVLQSGDPTALANVGKVLNPIWTSLPGGIEQGTNTDRFVSTYQRALNAGASPAQAQQVAQQEEAATPVQVASLDPSAGVAEATTRPIPEEYAATGLSQQAWDRMNAPDGAVPPVQAPDPASARVAQAFATAEAPMAPMAPMATIAAPALPAPQMVEDRPVAEPQQQIAQALMGSNTPLDQVPVMAGGTSGAMQPGQASQGINPAIIEALSNPAASEQTRKIAGMLLGQQMEQQAAANDPMRAMQLEKAQLELEQMRNPQAQPLINAGGGSIYNPNNGSWLTAPGADQEKIPEAIRALEIRAERAGLKPGTPEYNEFMINGGRGGTSLQVGPDGTVQFQQGGAAKPLTESQSKLTLFQSLQTETQPVLLDLEKQFNPANLTDAAARSTPIAGNFFKSGQGQIYDSAATAWAEGALRIATGAAATPEEMERTKRAYFAQPGDTPDTIAFKAQMREMYNRSINRSLGKASEGSLPKPSDFAKNFDDGAGSTDWQDMGGGVKIRRKAQ